MNAIKTHIDAVELPLEDGAYPELDDMLRYWLGKCEGRFAPPRAAIDPLDFPRLLPLVMLADVERDPIVFRYRLSGTGICDVHGCNPTGLTTDQLQPPEYGRLIYSHYCQCVDEKRPIQHLIYLSSQDKSRSYARLLLPLSEDGQEVTMLITIDSHSRNSREMRMLFKELTE